MPRTRRRPHGACHKTATGLVPTVKCTSSNSQASIWIGLDGKTDPTVEQVGLSTSCDLGTPIYQGWYEMDPKGTVYRGYYSHPGDLISLSVSYNYGNRAFPHLLQLSNTPRPHRRGPDRTGVRSGPRHAGGRWAAISRS